VSLATVYKSTELCLIQDKSEDYQKTWKFLGRRLEDLGTVGKTVRSVQEGCGGLGDLAFGAMHVVSSYTYTYAHNHQWR